MVQELNFKNFGAKPDLVLQGDQALSEIEQMMPICEKLSARVARLSHRFRCELEAWVFGFPTKIVAESSSASEALTEAAAEMKNRLMLGRTLSRVLNPVQFQDVPNPLQV